MSINNPIVVNEPIVKKIDDSLKTIFLLGAGASRPAGIPTINEMTEEFMENPIETKNEQDFLDNKEQYRKKFSLIKILATRHFPSSDLEHMMSVIISLQEKDETGKLLEHQYSSTINQLFRKFGKNNRLSINNFFKHDLLLNDLKNKIEYFVRTKCENIKNVEYLRPIEMLTENKPLKIFTLNYDATIEILCEQRNLEYTDGVNPYWNKKDFDNKHDVHLYKLHGSLYWLRTKFAKILKVPIKGLKISDVKYLTDEPVSEMMIYPVIKKNKQLEAYSWLFQKFREELNIVDLCIIIGYSFRDRDITDSIMESLATNQKLWLLLVNPNASQIKSDVFSHDDDIASRIIPMDTGIEDAITDRGLHSNLDSLKNARRKEETTEKSQARNKNRLDYDWVFILNNYIEIGHNDRVKRIVEDLSKQKFDGYSGSFPETVEGVVGPISIEFLVEYHKKNVTKYNLWKKIFLDYCTILEYQYFSRHSSDLIKKNNPVQIDDLPQGHKETGGVHINIIGIKERFEKPLSRLRIFKNISGSKLIDSLNALDERILVEGGGYRHPTDEQIILKYKKEELGIRKAAIGIIQKLDR